MLLSRQFAMGAIAAATLISATVAQAATVGPGDVKIDDGIVSASLTGQAGDPSAGAEVFMNRKQGNCLACHANSAMGNEPFHGEVGPSLDGVADRYSAEEMRAILVDSKVVLGGHTIMPAFYKVISDDPAKRVAGKFKDKTILEAQQIEDIIAYLQTLK